MSEFYTVKNSSKYIISTLIAFFTILNAISQDIQWAQYYSAPLYLNPAFAGAEHCDHYIFQQRVQWPGLQANHVSSYASYDRFLFQYRSGVGGYIVQDFQGISINNDENYPETALNNYSIDLSTTKVAAQYAYELPIDATHSVRAGLELGVLNSYLTNNFILPSEIDAVEGYQDTEEGTARFSKFAPDVSAGFLYYSKHLYAGFSGWHLNNPDLSFNLDAAQLGNGTNQLNKIARKGTFMAGYKINFSKTASMAYLNHKVGKSITPIVHYKFQEKSDQLDFGIYGVYDHAMFGTWYRGIPMKKNPTPSNPYKHNNESIVFMGGWKFNGWKWSVSYDWVVSTLASANPYGGYEFSMSYVPCRAVRKSKPMKRLPCPVPTM